MRDIARLIPAVFLAAVLSGPGIGKAIPFSSAPADESAIPVGSTPHELRDLWLQFHENELCQGLDTIFLFRPNGVEIWCVVEEGRTFERLKELIHPLRSRFQIGLYPTQPQPEKRSPEDSDPPPSLWNNEELRSFLRDLSAGTIPGATDAERPARGPLSAEVQLKQRILLFAEQTLDWNKKMRRYASEIPALARFAVDRSVDRSARVRARSICAAHAAALDRITVRLTNNLIEATPKKTIRGKPPAGDPKAGADSAPVESATHLSASAQTITKRVVKFIHPKSHTVPLSDLKESELIEALRRFRRQTADFQKLLAAAKP